MTNDKVDEPDDFLAYVQDTDFGGAEAVERVNRASCANQSKGRQ